MTKYCPECGSEMEDYSDFCRECGTRSSTHTGKYIPWSIKKAINSNNDFDNGKSNSSNSHNPKKPLIVKHNNSNNYNEVTPKRRGIFRFLPTLIGFAFLVLIFCIISSGFLNLDSNNHNYSKLANNSDDSLLNDTNLKNNDSIANNSSTNNTTNSNNTNNTTNEKTFLLIEYEGSWQGSVGSIDNMENYSGTNNKKIEFINMLPEEIISATIQKQDSSENLLSIKLVKNGIVIKKSETNTPYGLVTLTE